MKALKITGIVLGAAAVMFGGYKGYEMWKEKQTPSTPPTPPPNENLEPIIPQPQAPQTQPKPQPAPPKPKPQESEPYEYNSDGREEFYMNGSENIYYQKVGNVVEILS